MAKNKLNNLLSFKDHTGLKLFKKSTKRTDIGGDVVNEHHKNTPSSQKAYIVDKLGDASDGLITKIYNMVEKEVEA